MHQEASESRFGWSGLGVFVVCVQSYKKNSPSCGLYRVRLYNENGMAQRNAQGLYARALAQRLSLLPLEEEGRLNDMPLRENFVERVFAYYRWSRLLVEDATPGGLVKFHSAQKLTLMAHSPKHYKEMGRLVADAGKMAALKAGKTVMPVVEALGQIGGPAVLPLIAALDDPDESVRERAAMALGLTGDARAAEPLIAALYDSWDVQDSAETALVRIFEEHPNQLIPFLRSEDTVRVYRPMLRLGAPSTVTTLLKALETFGDESMATAFLNRGNETPKSAARGVC